MLRNYFVIALRNLVKYRLHSIINVLGLSVGIAISILIMILVSNELSYDRYNDQWQNIYRVNRKASISGNTFDHSVTPIALAETLKEGSSEVTEASRLLLGSHKRVSYQDVHFSAENFFYTDNSFFNIFSLPIILGDYKTPLEEEFSIVITRAAAERYFGRSDPIGEVLQLDNGWSFTVTAVCEDVPSNSHFHFDYLASLNGVLKDYEKEDWSMEIVSTYLLLQEDADLGGIESTLDLLVSEKITPQFEKMLGKETYKFETGEDFFRFYLQPLSDIHFNTEIENEFEPGIHKTYIYIFAWIAILILIIACVNFMNLATAKSSGRAKEVALRKVAGASRKQMIIQFLSESVFFTFAALFLSLVILELLLRPFNRFSGMDLDIFYLQNWYLIPSFILGALLIGIFSGSYPAFYLSGFNIISILKGRNFEGMRSTRLRGVLVLGQFAISIVLIIASLIIYQQVRFFKETNLGFNKDNVVVVQRAYALQKNKEAFKEKLLIHEGISHASFSLAMPGRVKEYFPVQLDTMKSQDIFYLNPIHADHDFLETMQLFLVEGKYFSNDSNCMNSIILNEAAVKRLGLSEPMGQVVRGINAYGEKWEYTVVGVVKDYHYESLHAEIEPLAMAFLEEKAHVQYLAVRLDGQKRDEALEHIENTWRSFANEEPFDYYFLDSDLNRQYEEEETTGQIFSIFSFLAIIIAALGLFGLAAHTAEQRTKEIGIRKAMGASGGRITMMLSVQFARWVLWANILAFPLAYAGMKIWLSRFAFHINIEAWFFLFAAIFAFVIALVTISYQAIKSARANPVHALQYE